MAAAPATAAAVPATHFVVMLTGQIESGQYEGLDSLYCRYTFASGDKYVGEYRDGKRNGQGTYTYANGHKYVGEFKDNVRYGKGILSFVDRLLPFGGST